MEGGVCTVSCLHQRYFWRLGKPLWAHSCLRYPPCQCSGLLCSFYHLKPQVTIPNSALALLFCVGLQMGPSWDLGRFIALLSEQGFKPAPAPLHCNCVELRALVCHIVLFICTVSILPWLPLTWLDQSYSSRSRWPQLLRVWSGSVLWTC